MHSSFNVHTGNRLPVRVVVICMMLFVFFMPIVIMADEIKMGISYSIPPYVIKENNTGIELDILHEALSVKGHTVNPKYMPFIRTFQMMQMGLVDGIINVKKGTVEDAFYTDVVITFQNCAISLAKNNFPDFENADFLRDKRVIAFQRAATLLGEDFGKMTKANNQYEEIANQTIQISRLLSDLGVDFIVMDIKIFKHLRKQILINGIAPAHVMKRKVKYHKFLKPSDYRFAFRSKKIRDDFNEGLRIIKKNGTFAGIFEKYEKQTNMIEAPPAVELKSK